MPVSRLACLALAAAFVAPAVLPPAASALAPDAKPAKRQQGEKAARNSPVERVRKAVETLDLQGEQKTKVEKVIDDAQAEMRDARKDQAGQGDTPPTAEDRADRREKMKAFQDKLVKDVKAQLKPEQAASFDAELAKSAPKGKAGGKRDGGGI